MEKYPWKVPEWWAKMSCEEKLDMSQKYLWGTIAGMLKAIKDRYGEEGLRTIYDAAKESGRELSKDLIQRLGIPLGKGSARDIIAVWDLVDEIIFTMKGKREIIEESPERIIYRAPECNVAEIIANTCPEVCSVLARAAEQGEAEAVNPNIKISGKKWLGHGDNCCEYIIEMKHLPQKNVGYENRFG